jgi:predicted lipid-binding transport protein (Tim44 family)
MLKRTGLAAITVFILATALIFLFVSAADAKGRMGGGKSFGSKPSYQRSAPSPAPTQPGLTQGAPQPQAASPMGGAGRWGGMLGGMLMGGLIGSMLFGGMGGYGGPGLMDILLIGGGLFLLMRFLRARRTASAAAGAAPGLDPRRLFSGQPGGGGEAAAPVAAAPAAVAVPEGFDQKEFMQGAKAIYTRLQRSWDKRDIEDIRQFTAPAVYAEIKAQADADPQPGKTDILLVNASLLEAKSVDGQTVATVLYDVTMREGAGDEPAKQVREIWHFGRGENEPGAHWVLEGIQQVEE